MAEKTTQTVSVIGNGQRVTVNNGSLNLIARPQNAIRQVLVMPVVQQSQSAAVIQRPPVFQQRGGSERSVILTRSTQSPLATYHQNVQSQGGIVSAKLLDRVLLKAVHKGNKKGAKMFTLRKIDPTASSSPDGLKSVMRKQLKEDVGSEDFDIGYVEGTNVVRIRSREDLAEF